jgi:hypothetical protein
VLVGAAGLVLLVGGLAGALASLVLEARGARGPTVGGPITRWHDHESCLDLATAFARRAPLAALRAAA